MTRLSIAAVLVGAATLSPLPGHAQSETTVTAAGAGEFPSGATFNGVSLDGLRFGMLVTISSTGSATGQFQTTLLETSGHGIEVEGEASSGSAVVAGTATFSGSCTVDLADGTPPRRNVRFTVTVTPGGTGTGTLRLVLDSTSFPTATVNEGSVTVE